MIQRKYQIFHFLQFCTGLGHLSNLFDKHPTLTPTSINDMGHQGLKELGMTKWSERNILLAAVKHQLNLKQNAQIGEARSSTPTNSEKYIIVIIRTLEHSFQILVTEFKNLVHMVEQVMKYDG